MTFTNPAPTGAGTTTVKRLAAVVAAVSSRCDLSDMHPAELERLLAFFGISKTVGRGQPHTLYGTAAIATTDYDRLVAMPRTALLEGMGRGQ